MKGTVICPMCRLAQPVEDAEAEVEVPCRNCGHTCRRGPSHRVIPGR